MKEKRWNIIRIIGANLILLGMAYVLSFNYVFAGKSFKEEWPYLLVYIVINTSGYIMLVRE